MASDSVHTDAVDVAQGGGGLASGKDVNDEDAQPPRVPANVAGPTAMEVELHNATHLPYRSWCRWCVMSRKPTPKHVRAHHAQRDVPLLVGDYAFVRSWSDEDLLTIHVGRLCHTKELIVIPCEQKGDDEYAVNRLANIIINSGVKTLVYMADLESALDVFTKNALATAKTNGQLVSAVPEHSAVGESQSNGKAERAVQEAEDMLRTMKLALEDRLNANICSSYPVLKWLCEHVAATINRYHIGADGKTAYQRAHEKRYSGHVLDFGERIYHWIPTRLRTKLDPRWADGIYLGTSQHSNEHVVGLPSGRVARGRGIARVPKERRWDTKLMSRIHGTPMDPNDEAAIEEFQDPHKNADDKYRDDHMNEHPRATTVPPTTPDVIRYRITKRDCEQHGYSLDRKFGCKRCVALAAGDSQTSENHSDSCRQRFYDCFVAAKDKRFLKWRQTSKEFANWRADQINPPLPPPPIQPPDLDDVLDYDPTFPDAEASSSADHDPGILVDALIAYGVTPVDAHKAVLSMTTKATPTTFYEVYGRGELTKQAHLHRRNLNIQGLKVLDLRTLRPNGGHWDLSQRSHRDEAWALIERDNPDWIIIGPPCTQFCTWQRLNHPRMDPTKLKALMKEARGHLKFACRLYRRQINAGILFLHEHPLSAASWRLPEVKRVMQIPGVGVTTCHQCRFGLHTIDEHGNPALAKKPTQFMSNSPFMLNELTRLCDGTHAHQHLVGGRAKCAEHYPLDLVLAILRGSDRTTRAMHAVNISLEAGWDAVMKLATENDPTIPSQPEHAIQASALPLAAGGEMQITFDPMNFKQAYFDEYTGEPLPSHLVRTAIAEELAYFNKMVWEGVKTDDVRQTKEFRLIRTRWVICSKGDGAEPDIRARLVACEVNEHKGSGNHCFFASTPPLGALKLLLSDFVSRRRHSDGSPLQISFVDIKKAYFHATPVRNIHLSFPREMGTPKGLCAHLLRCVYGTRDAGLLWEECYTGVLAQLGFKRGLANPCCFEHAAMGLKLVVHGDDFTCTGPKAALDVYEAQLAKYFEMKVKGRMGEQPGCVQELRVLNRVVRLCPEGLRYEADPRHAEILIRSLDVSGNRATPGDKTIAIEPDADVGHDLIPGELAFPDETYDENDTVAAIARVRCVAIGDRPTVVETKPYSETYDLHPKEFVVTADCKLKKISPSADPFTGKSPRKMQQRRAEYVDHDRLRHAQEKRKNIWIAATHFGPAWMHSENFVGAVRTPSAKPKWGGPSRQGAKRIKKLEQHMSEGLPFTPQNATLFRALSARANCLSQDRADIAFCSKELCREFAVPTVHSYERPKRMVRYLCGIPRLVYHYPWQSLPKHMNVPVDTDFAGCAATRRSTSGAAVMLGGHCVKHWASTHTVVSLSSGEAELHGISKGGTNAIGVQAVARDLGIHLDIVLHTDASATLGIVRRRGLGRIRHLDVTHLWLQEKIRTGGFEIHKLDGSQNVADVLTKIMDRPALVKHLTAMNLHPEQGRAASAPNLTEQS